jgi:hypothetical protein
VNSSSFNRAVIVTGIRTPVCTRMARSTCDDEKVLAQKGLANIGFLDEVWKRRDEYLPTNNGSPTLMDSQVVSS